MKITVDPKSFVEAVVWVSKGLDKKGGNANIVLELDENGECVLSHQNSFAYMKSPVDVTSIEDGEKTQVVLSGEFMTKMTKAFSQSKTDITLDYDSKTSLSASNGNGKFKIPVMKSPVQSKPEPEVLGEVNDAEYFNSILRVSKLCDSVNEGNIKALSAVDLTVNHADGTLKMMATDRYALGEITLEFDAESDEEGDQHYLIPQANSSLISPTKGSSDTIKIVYDSKNSKFGYQFVDGREALFVLQDADPIPYANMKNATSKMVDKGTIVSTKELTKTMGIIASVDPDDDSMRWTIDPDGTFRVHDKTSTNSIGLEDVSSDDFDDAVTLTLLRPVINAALSAVSSNSVKIKWRSDKSDKAPIILSPVLDNGEDDENTFLLANTKNKGK